jgi:hypothetical protein
VKRILLIAAVALALPGVALAKGPAKATLSGPGLEEPVQLGGYGPLPRLLDLSGLTTAFGTTGLDLLLPTRPPGELGPRYTLTWELHGSAVRQEVYPYAKPRPVTYTPSAGGWFVSTAELRNVLVRLGLPAAAPAGSSRKGSIPGIAAGAFAAGMAGLVLVRRRRRS